MSTVPIIKENNSEVQKSAKNWFDEGIENLRSDEFQKALECFEKVIEIDPKYKEVWFQMGFTYSKLYNAQKLPEDLYEDIPYISEKELEFSQKIIDSYEKAISFEPEDYGAFYNLGKHYQDNIKNYKKAIDYYKKALEFSPEFSYAWNNMGLAYDKMGNRQKSAECYEKAVKFDPENENAWVNFAINQHFLKNFHKSMECYGKAMELNPQDYNARNSLIAAMESIKLKIKQNKIEPDINLWLLMGSNYIKVNRYEKAIECLKKVIEADTQNFNAWHNIGIAYNELNDHKKFLACFEQRSNILKDLKKISIITTSQGPFYPDIFWLIESNSTIGIIPSEGPDSEFLLEVQGLPGFNNNEVIKAMLSTENNIFIVWKKKDEEKD